MSELDLGDEERHELTELGLITGKRMLYVANCEESEVGSELAPRLARALRAPVIELSAEFERELVELDPAEREEMLDGLGWEGTGLERLVRATFELLGLIRFYTVANEKLRAWEIPAGTPAPRAAGRVHRAMEEGFIRARVARWDDVVRAGGLSPLASEGKVRVEGKEYEVRDGDVLEFRF